MFGLELPGLLALKSKYICRKHCVFEVQVFRVRTRNRNACYLAGTDNSHFSCVPSIVDIPLDFLGHLSCAFHYSLRLHMHGVNVVFAAPNRLQQFLGTFSNCPLCLPFYRCLDDTKFDYFYIFKNILVGKT